MVNKNESDDESNVIIYADDNSPVTVNEDPVKLIENIENDGKKVTEWFSKNKMVCSGDKTKLLVSGTRANRRAKLRGSSLWGHSQGK